MGATSMGTLLNILGGNKETVEAITTSINKIIRKVYIDEENNILCFLFEDGSNLYVFDDGQDCCEKRFMVSDDDLDYYSQAILLDFEIKSVPEKEEEYGTEEIQFLDVKTSLGVFQIANHNIHNGYYGGFSIVAKN